MGTRIYSLYPQDGILRASCVFWTKHSLVWHVNIFKGNCGMKGVRELLAF